MTTPSRGDIVWVTFPDSEEIHPEEMNNPHMAVVMQNDGLNRREGSTIVIPITSGTSNDRLKEVDIPSYSEPVDHDSKAVLSKMTVVSIEGRIFDECEDPEAWKQGELSPEIMNEIENKLGWLLGV